MENYKAVELTLPDTFIFWDGASHEGDSIDGRTILQHVRSYTIIEVLDEELGVVLNDNIPHISAKFENVFGGKESLIFAVHFSHTEGEELQHILQKAKAWYLKYAHWEDTI